MSSLPASSVGEYYSGPISASSLTPMLTVLNSATAIGLFGMRFDAAEVTRHVVRRTPIPICLGTLGRRGLELTDISLAGGFQSLAYARPGRRAQ